MEPGAKPAVQARSKRTRDAIVMSLDGLLREKDFEAISVAEIAARAGVSAASIYQRFTNKDAAVSILLELHMRAIPDWVRSNRDDVMTIFSAPSLRDALLVLGATAWRQCEELGYVMRPAYLYSRLRPDLLGEQWRVQLERTREDFRVLLNAYRAEIRRTDLDRAAGMVASFYNMMFAGLLLHRDDRDALHAEHGIPDTPEAFAGELADFACGYLSTAQTHCGDGSA